MVITQTPTLSKMCKRHKMVANIFAAVVVNSRLLKNREITLKLMYREYFRIYSTCKCMFHTLKYIFWEFT